MKLNSKLTGGLAWAGLVVVLAVPSADMLTKPAAQTATITSDAEIAGGTDAVETASIRPAVTPVVPATRKARASDPVDALVAKGKKLPDYISDAPREAAEAAAPTAPMQPVAVKPVVGPSAVASMPVVEPDGSFADDYQAEVATVAPKPYPASMRPTTTTAAALPSDEPAPLIIDEGELAQRQAALRPPAPIVPVDSQPLVTGEDLEEWDSGSLAEYLERRGLINEQEPTASRRDDLDEDGFFLNEGPNRSGARVIRRLDDDDGFFLF